MHVTKGQIARYTLLPGILPRLFELLGPGRGFIAYWMALIYSTVQLIPRNHPYLQSSNRGKFGVRHVIGEAGRNLTWDLKHTDQIIVFFTLLVGIVMLVMQFFLFALALFVLPAFAITNYVGVSIPTSPLEVFVTANPEQDIAFILLDLVFGVPDSGGTTSFFNSCIGSGAQCTDTKGQPLPHEATAFPFPFHNALREVWALYSYGLFLVGCLIIIYWVITIAGEMAASGSPFGRRFNRLWAPIRLMFFFFLIVPIVHNLNIAQMGTLHVAKFGSSMATNAWLLFNEALVIGDTTILGANDDAPGNRWIIMPETPQPGTVIQFMQTVTACKYAERLLHNKYVQAYVVRNPPAGTAGNDVARLIYRYPTGDVPTPGVDDPPGGDPLSFREALEFSDSGDIAIRFGEYDPRLYTDHKGFVNPWCGEMVLPNPGCTVAEYDNNFANSVTCGPMFALWIILSTNLWANADLHTWGNNIARNLLLNENNALPSSDDMAGLVVDFYQWITDTKETQVNNFRANSGLYVVPEVLQRKGWAGAAIWYNRIAQLNGGLMAAFNSIPRPKLWPAGLEQVLEARKANNSGITGTDRFDPNLADGKRVQWEREEDIDIARVERFAFNMWQDDAGAIGVNAAGQRQAIEHRVVRNPLIDSINMIFGTKGLFDMRENADVHPLAQLVGAGKGLVDSAILAFGFSAGMTVGGGLWGILTGNAAPVASAMASVAKYVGIAGLLAGVILFYVVPFMPFIYFFFAVCGWVKAIFEAMVGVPLWALAHLRIDGQGLPGPGGMNGYFLLFEIFVRPTLIVFGLVASVSVLAAVVSVLNQIFDLVVVNLTGHDPNDLQADDPTKMEFYRNTIDQFFYTIIYVIIVYMMALSCFKLIDLVPGNIMRWMGASIAVFGDAEKDSAGQVTRLTSMGSTSVGMQLNEASSGLQQGAFMGHFFGGK